jgi:hypothetical protein
MILNLSYIDFSDKRVENLNFRDKYSLLDYKIIIMDLNEIWHEPEYYVENFEQKISKIKNEINILLKSKYLIIIFTPLYQTEEVGFNRYFENFELIPFDICTNAIDSKSIKFCGNDVYLPFYKFGMENYYSKAYFDNLEIGIPFMNINDDENLNVGIHISDYDGDIVFLPKFNESETNNNRFIDCTVNFYENLYGESGDIIEAPNWLNDIKFPGEKKTIDLFNQKNEEIIKLNNDLNDINLKRDEFNEFKTLLYGTGTFLEDKIMKFLKTMDLDVEKGAPKKADLIFDYNEKHFVVEVKGPEKSAKLKDVRQLENWVTDDPNEETKGLLIINPFRETPFSERKYENCFPSNVKEYSQKRNHCLMTTKDLLNLYFLMECESKNLSQEIEKIYGISGVYNIEKNFINE